MPILRYTKALTIGKAGQRLADQRIALLQLAHQKGAAGSDTCSVHGGDTALGGTAHLGGKHTGIKSADILEVTHVLLYLL